MADDYKASIRDKASGSIYNLRTALERDPVVAPADRRRSHSSDSRVGGGAVYNIEHADQSYSSAARKLKDLLNQTEGGASLQGGASNMANTRDEIVFELNNRSHSADGRRSQVQPGLIGIPAQPITHQYSMGAVPGIRQPSGDRPSSDEAVLILQHEAARVQHLEHEKQSLVNEIRLLKQRIVELVHENESLHDELRHSVIQEIRGSSYQNNQNRISQPMYRAPDNVEMSAQTASLPPHSKIDYSKWHTELEKIKSLHIVKSNKECTHTGPLGGEEAERSSSEVKDLQSRLRYLESSQWGDPSLLPTPSYPGVGTGGLCVACAENEAVLPPSVNVLQKKQLYSVTRDRDDLMEEVELLKKRYTDLKYKHDEGYAQIKSSVQLAEQAHLEMTQALVEREQMREEVKRLRQRLQDQILEQQNNTREQCDLVRLETHRQREDLKKQVRDLMEQLAEVQVYSERMERERRGLGAELDIVKDQLSASGTDYTKTVEELKVSMSQMRLDRNIAVQQADRLKQELDQVNDDRHAERQRLREEIELLRRRVDTAERSLLVTKDECLQLHNSNQTLERELHSARLAAEGLEQSGNTELERTERRAVEREAELNALIGSLQTKHARTTGELEEYVGSHESLVQRLREECKNLLAQLENLSNKYKSENRKLRATVRQLREQLLRSKDSCKELTEQHRQQSSVQQKMRERLNVMDSHSQNNSQQILELLSKESILMRERRELVNHIDFLHRQIQHLSGLGVASAEGASSSGDDWQEEGWLNFINLYEGSTAALQDIMRQAYEKRFPTCKMIPVFLGSEILSDTRSPDGAVQVVERRCCLAVDAPYLLKKLVGVDCVYFLQKNSLDRRGRTLSIVAHNDSFSSRVLISEHCLYSVHPENPNWTCFEQDASLDIKSFMGFEASIEKIAMKQYTANIKKGKEVIEFYINELISEGIESLPQWSELSCAAAGPAAETAAVVYADRALQLSDRDSNSSCGSFSSCRQLPSPSSPAAAKGVDVPGRSRADSFEGGVFDDDDESEDGACASRTNQKSRRVSTSLRRESTRSGFDFMSDALGSFSGVEGECKLEADYIQRCLGELTPYQESKLVQLRRWLQDTLKDKIPKDSHILRFLKAREFNIEKGREMLCHSLAWRKLHGIDRLLGTYEPPPVLQKYYPGGWHYQDKEGRPLYILRLGQMDVKGLMKTVGYDATLRHVLAVNEEGLRRCEEATLALGHPVTNCTCIVDLDGLSMRHLWRPGVRALLRIIEITEANYPETMGYLLIVRAPRVFPVLWTLVSPFIDERTRDKFLIYGGKNCLGTGGLSDFIPSEYIPDFLGGDCYCGVPQGGIVPKSLYRLSSSEEDLTDKERTGGPVGSGLLGSDDLRFGVDSIYHTAYIVKDFTHEVLLQVPERGCVITWDFDILKGDVTFTLMRCRRPITSPLHAHHMSGAAGGIASVQYLDKRCSVGVDISVVEAPIVCRDGDSIQGSHVASAGGSYILQWKHFESAKGSFDLLSSHKSKVMYYTEILQSDRFRGSMSSLQSSHSGFSQLSVSATSKNSLSGGGALSLTGGGVLNGLGGNGHSSNSDHSRKLLTFNLPTAVTAATAATSAKLSHSAVDTSAAKTSHSTTKACQSAAAIGSAASHSAAKTSLSAASVSHSAKTSHSEAKAGDAAKSSHSNAKASHSATTSSKIASTSTEVKNLSIRE